VPLLASGRAGPVLRARRPGRVGPGSQPLHKNDHPRVLPQDTVSRTIVYTHRMSWLCFAGQEAHSRSRVASRDSPSPGGAGEADKHATAVRRRPPHAGRLQESLHARGLPVAVNAQCLACIPRCQNRRRLSGGQGGAPWEGTNERRCLKRPPRCHADGSRCADSRGVELVR
jgi:hypothetical protein